VLLLQLEPRVALSCWHIRQYIVVDQSIVAWNARAMSRLIVLKGDLCHSHLCNNVGCLTVTGQSRMILSGNDQSIY